MSTDPSDPLAPSTEPEVLPSSTPDGPQVIPTHGTPEGEPGPDSQPDMLDESLRGSNPNSAGRAGLSGGMGVSSERTGPAGPDPRGSDLTGTGSAGGAVNRTDGGNDTSPTSFDAPDVSQRDINPMPAGSEKMTGAGNDPTGEDVGNIDRTVGEPMPNPIPGEKSRRGNHEPDVSRAQ